MKVLPYYLAIGMPYELFWHGDPYLVNVYKQAHDLQVQQKNQEMWVQGIYNYRAFSSVIETFSYALSGKKGSKPSEYPKEPLPITEAEQRIIKERDKKRAESWFMSNQ